MLKSLDIYIIKKFLGTFFLTLALFILIAIVFDVVEKLEDFMTDKIPVSEIIFEYYINFILNSGITFNRMLVPYFIASLLITALNIYANHWVIPDANKKRLAFTDAHVGYTRHNPDENIHMQVTRNEFMYLGNFNVSDSS